MEWTAVRFTRAARRHRIGRASALHVMTRLAPSRTTTVGGASAWLWVGEDERGRELEIIGVTVQPADEESFLLVIHVMPTHLRG
jgi:hypothetical protein